MTADEVPKEPTCGTIHVHANNGDLEVLRISRNGIWANPDVPVDQTARLVLASLEAMIRQMIATVEAEREVTNEVR